MSSAQKFNQSQQKAGGNVSEHETEDFHHYSSRQRRGEVNKCSKPASIGILLSVLLVFSLLASIRSMITLKSVIDIKFPAGR